MGALMKGHTFKDHGKKMTYPAIAEVKVDEIRLDVRRVHDSLTFNSFADKPLHNLGQFAETFCVAMQNMGITRLDMGVLVNGNFNDTYRFVRSSKGIPSDLLGARIEFILFDLPEDPARYEVRVEDRALVAGILADHGLLVTTPVCYTILRADDVIPLFNTVRGQGFEGLMLKSLGHRYEEGKRSYGWLKVKPNDDADGVITDFEEAVSINGVPLERAGCVVVRCEDGSIARPAGIRHDLAKDMWDNPEKYIGQWCEFSFMERDRQGGYRHPIFNRVREAKA